MFQSPRFRDKTLSPAPLSDRDLSLLQEQYDRQLRLWGDVGQRNLQDSSVCLIRATATGCEIMKNLILPGTFHVKNPCSR